LHNKITERVILSSNVTKIFWNSLDKVYEDQLDFSVSTQFNLTQKYTMLFGTYFTDRKLDEDNNYFHNPRNATFFTMGLKVEFDYINIIAEILDSTLSSAENREQTIFKLGCNFEFNK